MSFELKIQKYINEQQLVKKGDRLLIACSGGIDSMGLVHFFMKFQHNLEIELFVAHVDHMLRGETSAEDRSFVEQFCLHHKIPIFSTAIPIPRLLEEEGGNSQALCRRERYAFFEEMMKTHQINKLVTAHHADDQLESILMALTKSGNLSSMKGIYSKREFSFGTIIRPFLAVTKEEIREYLEGNGGTYREDASNEKDDYTRNRFRHHIVPLLKNENVQVSSHAVHFAETLQQDDELLNNLALERFPHIVNQKEKQTYTLSVPLLQKEPVALQRRIILILLNYIYNNSNFAQGLTMMSSILNLCKSTDGSAKVYLPEQFIANRKYDKVVFEKLSEKKDVNGNIQHVVMNQWTQLQNGIRLYIGEASKVVHAPENNSTTYYFSSELISTPLYVRTRKNGDRILLKGMSQQKRLSRLFIDEKIPLEEREHWPVLVDSNDEVLAVIGVRVSGKLSTKKQSFDDSILIIERK